MIQRRVPIVVLVAAVLLLAGHAGPSAAAPTPGTNPTTEGVEARGLRIADSATSLRPAARVDPPATNRPGPGEEAVATALNNLRAAVGAPTLRLDPQLSAIAREWSEEMARSGFRHSSGPYAENIAWIGNPRLHPDAAAAMFISMWRDSPGHYANMTNPRHREVGIGLYLDANGWWATQLFR